MYLVRNIISPTIILILFFMTNLSLAETTVIKTGSFEGRSDHVVKGKVSILQTSSGYVVVLEPDFSLDNAPDPKIGLGKNGYDASTQFSKLNSISGLQAYNLPSSIDPNKYSEVWLWCEEFNVPLGVANLN